MHRLTSHRRLILTLGLGGLLASACFPDWDSLDPSLAPAQGGGSSTTTVSAGGSGVCTPGETAPCYDGPDGTEGVGVCAGGETTCNEDGTGFGPCEGSVTPGAESCDTPEDDDCDGEVNELDAGCSCQPGALRDCYDGPMGSDGMGICARGQQLCVPSGDAYTACVGQTLPQHEECGSVEDDDCDGEANERCPVWGKIFAVNGANDDLPQDIEVLPNGDHVVVGIVEGGLDFGSGNLPAQGGEDVFVARFDADGNELWSRRFGSATNEQGLAVAIGANDNIYVVGEFSSTLPLGGGFDLTAQGTEDGYVFAMDADGNVLWSDAIGAVGANVTALSVAVDAAGNVAVGGDFGDAPVDFGGGPVTPTSLDGFVLRYDATGARTSSVTFGSAGSDEANALAFVGNNLAVAGTFGGSVNFGGAGVIAVDGVDGFVAMIDGANQQQWITPIGAAGDQLVFGLSTDGTNVYVVGEGNGTIVIDGNANQADAVDVFVAALGPNGAVLWGRHFIGPDDQRAASGGIAVDGGGEVAFVVSHESVVDYGDGPLDSAGNDDWAVVRLMATNGDTTASTRIGNNSDNDPRGVGIDQTGHTYVVGDCVGDVDFGFGPVIGNSYENICLAKFAP